MDIHRSGSNIRRRVVARGLALLAVAAGLAGGYARPAIAADVTTSFEFTDLDGMFTLGTSPNSVEFQGGQARSVGVTALYKSGLNSWMISSGGTGTILFETPAQSVTFWFRDETASVASVVTAFDEADAVIATFTGTTVFQQVVLDQAGPERIARITVTHNGASGRVAVDEFASCTGVLPGPLADPLPSPIGPSSVAVELVPVAEGLTAPNWGTTAPGDANRLFVSDQAGILWAIETATGSKSVFLDASSRLVPLGIAGSGTFDERGLLAVAFHPAYASNGLLYTYTSEPEAAAADFSTIAAGESPDHQSVVAEWHVVDPGNPASVVDPGSFRELLRIDEPQFNHNGGGLAFGPDGFLYISLGDGGNADDEGSGHSPGGNGQDPGNVLGTILRIDPLGTNAANGEYGIPASNPFVPMVGTVEEIWAYGFRNPFRFSFDGGTGDLYVADVGQNDIEEIDLAMAGGNFGWPRMEGSFFFDGNGAGDGFVTAVDPGGTGSLLRPVAEYDHDEGSAIIGGFVYRGSAIPELAGRYVFGDFARTFSNDGRLFHLDATSTVVELNLVGGAAFGRSLLGFGQDAAGELYVMANSTGTPFGSTGVVLRIAPPQPLCAPSPEAAASCRLAASGKSLLQIKDKSPGVADAKDSINWKWSKGDATLLAEFGDPAGGAGTYRLCLYDGSGLLRELDLPTGAGGQGDQPGWFQGSDSATSGSFTFRDKSGGDSGVVAAKLKAGETGKAQLKIKAAGLSLEAITPPLAAPVTAQLLFSDGSGTRCWQTTFPTPTKNEDGVFKAKGPS